MADQHHPPAGPAGRAHAPTDNPDVRHEETDVDIRAILLVAAGMVVTTLALAAVVWGVYRYLDAREARQPAPVFPLAVQQEQRLPPEPRLQTNPREDMLELRRQEDAILTTYGWVDRNAGTVRIPIEEAMKLTITRGLPSRAAR